jgi:5-bromo-4-chloroindolyl phosphate hydrolysis protein
MTTALAGILGAAAFIAFFVVIQAGILFSLLATAAAFAAGLLLANEPRTMKVKLDGVNAQSLSAALAEAEAKLAAFESLIPRLESKPIKAKAQEIAELERKIIEDIEADPKDLKPARSFLTYYQDAAINILRKYQQIMERGASAADVRASVARVEPVLETIRASFEKQLARLLENDALDLDTEISVLEKTLKMEGLDIR